MKRIKCVRETRQQKLKFTFVLGPTTILHMNNNNTYREVNIFPMKPVTYNFLVQNLLFQTKRW